MQGKLIEILIILMQEINHRGIQSERMEVLSGELLNRGYSEQEISTAFSWVLERMNLNREIQEPDPRSFRVLHNIEKVFISAEAFGYLLQLQWCGLINSDELERIIERALAAASPSMEVKEMNSIVMEVLFGDSEPYWLEGDNFLPEDLVQ